MRFINGRDFADRHGNSATRMPVQQADDTQPHQEHTLNGFSGEQMSTIEHMQPYGISSVVQPATGEGDQMESAEGMTVFMGSNRTHGITVVTADRRYRVIKLANGEVTFHDDQGQQFHFRRDGIWGSVPNSKQIKLQIMDDNVLPQDGSNTNDQGQQLGQVQQAGRPAQINLTLDKNQFTLNHPNGAVTVNCASFSVNASGGITQIAGGDNNVKGANVFMVGPTNLGVDSLSEHAKPIVPDVDGDPAKQTFVKIG